MKGGGGGGGGVGIRVLGHDRTEECYCLIWSGSLMVRIDIHQPSLPTPFYSVLVSLSVFMALSTVFHSINSPDNSSLFFFSHSVLLV